MSDRQKTSNIESAAIYRIQARGTLDESWSNSVGNMDIVIKQDDSEAITTLNGELPDQAALSGVLNLLYDLGLSLLSVECLDEPTSVEDRVKTSRDDFATR